ncbi:RluA family pseudouridine synthase [Variovorax sp. VNK109]|uniref:RluA family pseudouridine synthase n=1 Tax=Variovorax sp. VNK109 TaxID=3400919 RepID=UPI003BFF40B8
MSGADLEPLRVLHADDALLVFDKPAGLLSVPGRGEDKQDCLSARAQRAYPDALVVHRLDMATSGILVMGRGAEMQRRLSIAFAGREVRKQYQAVAHGMLHGSGDGWQLIDAAILLDWPRRPLHIIDAAHGKPSTTRWRVIETMPGGKATRVELEPVTGRTHQLRVHLQHIGHPILGDRLYAPPDVQALSPRLLLHACALEIAHPATGKAMRFTSDVPF